VSRDLDGDGIIDRYTARHALRRELGLQVLMFQRRGQVFDQQGEVAFATRTMAQLIRCTSKQTRGPHKDRLRVRLGAGRWSRAMTDGLVLFQWAPDWRSWVFAR